LIEKHEALLKISNEWAHFSNPHQIISAASVNDVYPALQEVERLVNSNQWHAAGFMSYEAAPAFDNALRVNNADGFPLLWFGLYSEPKRIQLPISNINSEPQNWQATVERASYNYAIEKVKDHIARGNTYQVNYTMRLQSEMHSNEWNFFLKLASAQNKYAAYIDTGRYVICSASPELFFKLDGERIFSNPMKGTVKRGRTTIEDARQVDWLQHSIKNRAENVMIVDMVRNDLGRIAEIGSVQVPELFKIEKYPTLFQMTSSVQAKTSASLDEIFAALFPCASITGAPKVSTMKIIAQLETTPRRIYSGSIGYIAPNRKAQFNVAIRTALIDREHKNAEYGVGGGIVWDSTSVDEFDEALLKARVLTEQPLEFSLIETLLWTREDGYFLREKHIDRMSDSSEYFDINFSRTAINGLLDETQKIISSPQRIRVLLDRSGKFIVETMDLPPQKTAFKVKIASSPIDSSDRFYFHKTNRREIYPVQDNCDDILMYNEKDELTEFTIGNLVAEIDGKWVTPPVSCGLLAGTFRAPLLETGMIREQILHKDELSKCSKIFLINSVRKWVEAGIK